MGTLEGGVSVVVGCGDVVAGGCVVVVEVVVVPVIEAGAALLALDPESVVGEDVAHRAVEADVVQPRVPNAGARTVLLAHAAPEPDEPVQLVECVVDVAGGPGDVHVVVVAELDPPGLHVAVRIELRTPDPEVVVQREGERVESGAELLVRRGGG
jgi:hypothetical protein